MRHTGDPQKIPRTARVSHNPPAEVRYFKVVEKLKMPTETKISAAADIIVAAVASEDMAEHLTTLRESLVSLLVDPLESAPHEEGLKDALAVIGTAMVVRARMSEEKRG